MNEELRMEAARVGGGRKPDESEGLERAGHLRPGPPPTGVHVTTTWHLRLIAVVTALGVIAVVGALLA